MTVNIIFDTRTYAVITDRVCNMNGFQIDIEDFRGDDGRFVIKRLSVLDVEHGLSRVVLIKPP